MHVTDLLASSAKKAQYFFVVIGHDEPYSSSAISLMRHNITHRDVQIKVEIVYITGTFIGSLWESITNVGAILLANGSGKEDSPACDVPGFENNKMTFMRHISFVDFQESITPITVITIWEYMDTEI
ncbi:ribonuclease TUDOR 1-like protein [Tanacetum coccineum]